MTDDELVEFVAADLYLAHMRRVGRDLGLFAQQPAEVRSAWLNTARMGIDFISHLALDDIARRLERNPREAEAE